MAKIERNKAKVFIYKAGTKALLAGQRNCTLSEINSESYQINCDRAYILDADSYEVLKAEYKGRNNVDVYIELQDRQEYLGNCSITAFNGGYLYDELTEFYILLQSNKPLKLISNN